MYTSQSFTRKIAVAFWNTVTWNVIHFPRVWLKDQRPQQSALHLYHLCCRGPFCTEEIMQCRSPFCSHRSILHDLLSTIYSLRSATAKGDMSEYSIFAVLRNICDEPELHEFTKIGIQKKGCSQRLWLCCPYSSNLTAISTSKCSLMVLY